MTLHNSLKFTHISFSISVDLETKNVQGLCFNPITFNWSLIDDPSVNYALHAIRASSGVVNDKQDHSKI
jgi:2-polyprenyl-3-methyl-5-hydroxy-6-metoxy-1,4-benzoquinol methylase